ncbi:MAG: D-alanyl-D-alanine carboxypeptidase [Microbacteriaceae bacterium]
MSSPATPPAARPPRSRLALVVAGAAVGALALCAGSFGLGYAVAPTGTTSAAPAPTATGDADRAVPATIPDATDIRTCRVSDSAKADALDDFAGIVVDVSSGSTLFSRDGKTAAAPGGTQLLATAAAALDVLGTDYRMTTTVVAGSTDDSIVLVGGGDPTLSRLASGESVYPDAPTLADLAEQVQEARGADAVPITSIILDDSYWDDSDAWDSSWSSSLRSSGYLSEVTALQTDGDRSNPANASSKRSDDPVMMAGLRFAKALGVPDATLQLGLADAGAEQLASVQSQPVSSLVNTMLLTGDATLAETLGRVTSIVAGEDGSRASLQQVIVDALDDLGIDASGQTFYDASGTSADNAVSPWIYASLLATVRSQQGVLDVVYNSLSVPGEEGTLSSRFDDDTSASAASAVRGLATAITGERTLAGLVETADGSRLAFAFTATRSDVGKSADTALDALVADVYSCGANLSNK